MNNLLPRHLYCFTTVFALIILDQISKWYISAHLFGIGKENFIQWITSLSLPRAPFGSIEILPHFNLVMVWNQGVSFGLFSQDSDLTPWILTGISSIITIVFTAWLSRATHRLQIAGLIFVIAGAVGNIIDRVRFGAVIDFLDVHVAGYHWPAFNFADSYICIGVGLLLIHSLLFEDKG